MITRQAIIEFIVGILIMFVMVLILAGAYITAPHESSPFSESDIGGMR